MFSSSDIKKAMNTATKQEKKPVKPTENQYKSLIGDKFIFYLSVLLVLHAIMEYLGHGKRYEKAMAAFRKYFSDIWKKKIDQNPTPDDKFTYGNHHRLI